MAKPRPATRRGNQGTRSRPAPATGPSRRRVRVPIDLTKLIAAFILLAVVGLVLWVADSAVLAYLVGLAGGAILPFAVRPPR